MSNYLTGTPLLIGVDVDEVVADLIAEWLRLYNEEYDDTVKPEDIHGWNIDQYVKCGKSIYHFLSRDDFYANVKPIPGALEAIKELRTLGRVIFVTSCAKGTMDQKFAWLQRNGFLPWGVGSTSDFVACRDKWLVGVDVLFDDGVHNVEPFRGHAFLVGHHHNRTTPCRRERISSLAEAPSRVRQLLAEGKGDPR